MSVGWRVGDRLGRNIARRAGPVLDDKRLAELFGQVLADEPSQNVRGATRRITNDPAYRAGRIGLCPRTAREPRQRGSTRSQMQKRSTSV